MKKLLLLFSALVLFSGTLVSAQGESTVSYLKIGESFLPSLSFTRSGEQLTGQAFQQDALITHKGYQYTVYYNSNHNVCIARRKMPVGQWEEIVLPYKNKADDAHNVISMGICANDGSIHLSYDHHNDPLHYCYSIQGSANDPENMIWDASSFSETTNIMDAEVVDVTYPRFINKPDGNLLFECRYKLSGDGDSYLREYDANTKKWTYLGRYVQGRDATPDVCAYINRIDYDVKGNLHVSWCWREDYGGGSNKDLSYAYSDDDGRTWKDITGTQVAVTEKNYVPKPGEDARDRVSGECLRIGIPSIKIKDIQKNKGYINQESQTSDSKGRVHMINSYMDDGTDSNWSNSRGKAVLQHHFIDENGVLQHRHVKNNEGEKVNSYCRTQIVADAFDNVYVIANHGEVYVATDAANYEDWRLLAKEDENLFVSEPQVDRKLLLNEGILSFVYLRSDAQVVVISYLLDNPNTPTGTGLSAEYFSDNNFTTSISSASDVEVSNSSMPEGTQSVRWSGSFETLYGEAYTLYLTTAKAGKVYIDGKLVQVIKESASAQEYEITFDAITSHKHDIVIESQSTPSDNIYLTWSSQRTAKGAIPVTSLYPDLLGITPPPASAPSLAGRTELKTTLQGEKTINATSAIDVIKLPFTPAGDYSIEVKAQVNAAEGRGMDIEARNMAGKGFRVALSPTDFNWIAPLSNPIKLSASDNTQEQTFRFAVSGNQIYIFQNGELLTSRTASSIGDLKGDTETYKKPQTVAELGDKNLIKNPTFSNISNNGAPGGEWLSDGKMGGNTNPRVQVGNEIVPESISPTRTAFTIRFDYGGITYFAYPIKLKPNTLYEHSVDVIAWGSGRTNLPVDVIISKGKEGLTDVIFQETMYSPGIVNTGEKRVFYFKTPEAAGEETYYLTYRNTTKTSLVGITNLTMAPAEDSSSLLLGKNYEGGSANIKILYVKYEDGAFAPSTTNTPEAPALEKKETLPTTLQENIVISATEGQKSVQKLTFDPANSYTLEVSSVVSKAEGRGMDIEVADKDSKGFRTAISSSALLKVSPFASPVTISKTNNSKEVIRYAVDKNKVHVYRNGVFIYTFDKTDIKNMNAAGTAEETTAPSKQLLFGKNYTEGSANMLIQSITYDATGAYAPGKEPEELDPVDPDDGVEETTADDLGINIYTSNGTLYVNSINEISNIKIFDGLGRKYADAQIQANEFSTPLSTGFYILQIETTQGAVSNKIIIE